MEDDRKPEPKPATVPIFVRSLRGALVRGKFVLWGVDETDPEFSETLQWLTWAGECLRPETVDALAKGYQPFLAQLLAPDATELFLRAREDRLRSEGLPAVTDEDDRQIARAIVGWHLKNWVESSGVECELASLALISYQVNAWESYEQRMGKGAIERLYRATGLGGTTIDAISSDDFSEFIGRWFRDYFAPGLVRSFMQRGLPQEPWLEEIKAHLKKVRSEPDNPEPCCPPA